MENIMEEDDIKFEPDKSTFILNTKTTCFLCLSTNHGYNGDGGNEGGTNRVSLLSISRYLGISLKDFFSNNLDKGLFKEDYHSLGKISNCSVTLCEGCASITSRLSSLCLELEVLQMKVDHCFQSFLDELEDSEMESMRVQRFQLMKTENLEEVHVELSQMLRKKMKKQCDMKLNSIFPKVIIGEQMATSIDMLSIQNAKSSKKIALIPSQPGTPEFVKDEFEDEEYPEQVSPEEDNFDIQENAFQLEELVPENLMLEQKNIYVQETSSLQATTAEPTRANQTRKKEMIDFGVVEGDSDGEKNRSGSSPGESSLGVAGDHLSSPGKSSGKLKGRGRPSSKNIPKITSRYKKPCKDAVTCTLCNPPLLVGQRTFQSHKIRVHIDNLMTNYKLPTISTDDFKIYSNHVFKVETISSRNVEDSNGIPVFVCPYCNVKYRIYQTLRNHLFNEHKEILAKKIIELQKSSTVEDLKTIELPSMAAASSDGQTLICDDCGRTFSTKANLRKHKKLYCKFGNKCSVCGVKFGNKYEMKCHQEKFHHLLGLEKNSEVSTSIRKLQEIGPLEDSMEMENDEDEEDVNLELEDEDECQDEDNLHDGVAVKTEHYQDNLEAILPDIPEDDPLNL